MNTLFLFIFVYLAYLLIWLIINIVAYFLSLVFKTRKIVEILAMLAIVILWIFNFLLGIGLLVYAISVLLSGQILWFLILIFFGIGLISGLISYLLLPFVLITTYFAQKIEDINLDEDIILGEILDENDKVIGKAGMKKLFMKNKHNLIIALFLLLILLVSFFLLFKQPSKAPIVPPAVIPTIMPTVEEEQEIRFTGEQLKGYYSSYENPFVLHIRKALNSYLAGINEGIEPLAIRADKTEDGTIGGLDSFSKDYYKSKFIVFGINDSIVGGKEINIIFQDKQDKLFNVWIYRLGTGDYELRGFWQNKNFTENEMAKIQKQYKIYLEDEEHAL